MIVRNLPSSQTKQVYFAYFHSMATYGITIWGLSSCLEEIFKLQKKAIRILAGIGYTDSCRSFFRKLNILTMPSCLILACLEYAHTQKKTITKNVDVHNYNTRHANDMVIPYHRINKSQTNIHYTSIKLYNALPEDVKLLGKRQFKHHLKKYLIQKECYSMEEYYQH